MSRPGDLIADRYRLVELIAVGGMGTVWEAQDERLHRRVALKSLRPQPGLTDEQMQLAGSRAMREARITARLHHAHAVPVYDVVDHEGQPCLVMQYLPSSSLQTLLGERGTLGIGEVARIGAEVAAALAAAHQAGIVHRDVKPGNILVDPDGSAKITDFGISHALGDVTLTTTGIVTGTPAFLAPEVARGQDSGFAADVFSLGSTLYTAVEGEPPFGTSDNPMATLHRVASGQIMPPRRAGALTPVLLRMLAADPLDRPEMPETAQLLAGVASDPVAAATTEQFAAVPAAPPPSRTMSLPAAAPAAAVAAARPPAAARPAAPPPPPRRADPPVRSEPPNRHGRAWLLALLAVAVVAGVIIAVVASQSGGTPANNAASTGAPTTHAPASHTSSSPSPSPTTSHTSTSASPTTSASTPSPPAKNTKSKTPPGRTPSSTESTSAVSSYYALLPGNTDAAWQDLTPNYQQQAGGRSGYDQFWGQFSKVTATGLSSNGPGTATATITYTRSNGSTSSERRTFGLIRQGNTIKIDSSSVVG